MRNSWGKNSGRGVKVVIGLKLELERASVGNISEKGRRIFRNENSKNNLLSLCCSERLVKHLGEPSGGQDNFSLWGCKDKPPSAG